MVKNGEFIDLWSREDVLYSKTTFCSSGHIHSRRDLGLSGGWLRWVKIVRLYYQTWRLFARRPEMIGKLEIAFRDSIVIKNGRTDTNLRQRACVWDWLTVSKTLVNGQTAAELGGLLSVIINVRLFRVRFGQSVTLGRWHWGGRVRHSQHVSSSLLLLLLLCHWPLLFVPSGIYHKSALSFTFIYDKSITVSSFIIYLQQIYNRGNTHIIILLPDSLILYPPTTWSEQAPIKCKWFALSNQNHFSLSPLSF